MFKGAKYQIIFDFYSEFRSIPYTVQGAFQERWELLRNYQSISSIRVSKRFPVLYILMILRDCNQSSLQREGGGFLHFPVKINLDLNQASEGQISDRSESRVLIATLNGMSKGKRSHIGFKNLFLDTNIFHNFEISKKKKIFLRKSLIRI